MKIVKAESILVSVPFEATGIPPWSFGGNPRCAFDTLFVRLETTAVSWAGAKRSHATRTIAQDDPGYAGIAASPRAQCE
jgi:hypothetical protein